MLQIKKGDLVKLSPARAIKYNQGVVGLYRVYETEEFDPTSRGPYFSEDDLTYCLDDPPLLYLGYDYSPKTITRPFGGAKRETPQTYVHYFLYGTKKYHLTITNGESLKDYFVKAT